jgi:hypothetical protein
MQTFGQDLRYGARMLWKQPGFTLLAALTLALGVGSTTTIFSAIQNILLDPFPYTDASRRMALGAGTGDIVRMVLWMGLKLVGLGVVVGLLASFAVTQVIANQLWEVSPNDPLALSAAVAVVALAGLAACYFPARRATKVDPPVALRRE